MAKEHRVTLYRTMSCMWCHKTEEFFKKYHIKYREIDVGTDRKAAMEMVEKSGQMGVPVIVIDDKVVIVGYDVAALKKYLHIAG